MAVVLVDENVVDSLKNPQWRYIMNATIAIYISMAHLLCVYVYILWNVTSEKGINIPLAVSLYFSSMLLIFVSVCFLWSDTLFSGPLIFVYGVSLFYAVLFLYLILKEIAKKKEAEKEEIEELKREIEELKQYLKRN